MPGIEDIQLQLVESWADAERFRSWLGQRREFLAVDIETTGLNVGADRIRLVQFGDATHGWAFDYRDWRGLIKESIEGYEGAMVAHNLLFDSKFLRADGITIPQRLAHDSMIMTHLANPAANMGLKPAAARYVDKRAAAGQGLLGAAMKQGGWNWATIPAHVPAYWLYSALDTCLSALLAEKLYPSTPKRPYELEVAAIHCLREAEIAGLFVDEAYRQVAVQRVEAELLELRAQIPEGLNPNADKQVVRYLESLGARWDVKTETGQPSVKKEVLEWIATQGFPVASIIAKYRGRDRILNNYLLKMGPVGWGNGVAANGVLHPSTKIVGARTGRMSVQEPPLQQLPRGRVVRDGIVAREGHCFVMADFSGMEMRALASFAQERAMLDVYAAGDDLHDFAARELYGVRFTKQERTVCKNGGFAKIYGAGIPKFAATAKIDIPTATAFMQRYDQLFPGVKTYMEQVVAQVIERAGGNRKGYGYVELIDGRRIPVEADEAYKGVNYTIQGGCAVVTKEKIVELDAAGLGPYFRLAVHDELIYEVPLGLAAEARDVIERVMPDRKNWPGVTLEIESDIVSRWGEHYRDDFPAYVPTAPAPWLQEVAA